MAWEIGETTAAVVQAVVWHAALRSGAVDVTTGGRADKAIPVLYVDKNPWGRALDDHSVVRNAEEARSFEELFAAIARGDARLAYSSIAYGEGSPRDGSLSAGRRAIWGVIGLRLSEQQLVFHDVRADTEVLATMLHGAWTISGHDALHAAAAALEGAWYFVTGDDQLLKRLNRFFTDWGLPFDAVTPAWAVGCLRAGARLVDRD